jgi:hypothetical protein
MIYKDDQTIGAYQNEVAEGLRALASRLQAVEAAVENSAADIRIKNQQQVDQLSWRLKEIETRLDELPSADESEWEARSTEIDTAMNELAQEIENALTLLGR